MLTCLSSQFWNKIFHLLVMSLKCLQYQSTTLWKKTRANEISSTPCLCRHGKLVLFSSSTPTCHKKRRKWENNCWWEKICLATIGFVHPKQPQAFGALLLVLFSKHCNPILLLLAHCSQSDSWKQLQILQSSDIGCRSKPFVFAKKSECVLAYNNGANSPAGGREIHKGQNRIFRLSFDNQRAQVDNQRTMKRFHVTKAFIASLINQRLSLCCWRKNFNQSITSCRNKRRRRRRRRRRGIGRRRRRRWWNGKNFFLFFNICLFLILCLRLLRLLNGGWLPHLS